MITLTDKGTLELLHQANAPAEIRDESGAILGVFTPIHREKATHGKKRTAEEEAAYWYEIAQRVAEPGEGIPLYKVYEKLLTLTDDERLKADMRQRIAVLKEQDQCLTS